MTTELEAETKEPHPALKGIISTNDDPFTCALCHDSMGADTDLFNRLTVCCGKGLCESCYESYSESGSLQTCLLCHSAKAPGALQVLKKHAKKGHPWAHHWLGDLQFRGLSVRKSYCEAFGWYDMAAKKGHPDALEKIGMLYLQGGSIAATDLPKAQECFEAALSMLPTSMDVSRAGLLEVVKKKHQVNTDESNAEAKSILLAITKDPLSDPFLYDQSAAFYALGRAHYKDGNDDDAYEAFVSSMTCAPAKETIAPMGEVAHFAMLCAGKLGLLAQTRFWFGKVKLSEITDHGLRRLAAGHYFRTGAMFRKLRDKCGGCGAEFEGRDRKYCRRCRTFCYCSRDCQKLHWNRKEDGHREDCLGMKETKEQLMEVAEV